MHKRKQEEDIMMSSEFVAEMVKAGFNNEDVRKALKCFDVVLEKYNVTPREANIVQYDGNNVNKYYYDTYLACREFQGYSKSSLYNIKLYLKKFIEQLPCSLTEVTPMQVRLFLYKNKLSRKGTPVKNSSLDKIKQILSSFYKWMLQERQVNYNPAEAVEDMKVPTLYKGCLQQEELERLKYACDTLREKTIIEVCVSTGCRIAELAGIKTEDINIAERSIKVFGKGSKERVVYFSAEAKLLIEAYLRNRTKKESKYLFENTRKDGKVGTAQMRKIIEGVFDRVKDKISLKNFTPHTLRRTFATLALRKGMLLEQVSKLLGHANLQTTMRYVDLEQSELQGQHSRLIA